MKFSSEMTSLLAKKVYCRVAAIYAVVSGLWILLSDQILLWYFEDPAQLTSVQTVKGWFFVFSTAVMLAWLVRHYTRHLERERELLTKAQEIGRIGTWELDILNNGLVWTDESCRIFGVPLGSIMGYELFLEKIHPDDHEFVDREWKAAMQGKPYDIEHRIVIAEETRWVREKADVTFDAKGNAINAIGFVQDITDRKQKEQDLQYREAFETLIARISTRFIELTPSQTDQGIDLALKDLGNFSGVDRIYVFLFTPENVHMDNTHEWCAEGITPQKENLQGMIVSDLAWAMNKILNKQVLYVPSTADLPPEAQAEREHWQAQDIQSLIAVPILSAGEVRGLLGFDVVGSEKPWGGKDITLLQTIGHLFGNAIEHQQAERAQKENERRLSTLLGNLPGMAYRCRIDRNWTMAFVSDGCRALTGYLPEDLIGNRNISFADIIHPEDREDVWQQVQVAIERKEPFQTEYRICTAGGKERWVWEQGRGVFDEEGALLALEGFISDINERRNAMETLQKSDRMKTEFVNTVAHEFRTPLTAIQGFSEALLTHDQLSPEQQKECLGYIHERSMGLADLVDDILDIARIESGKELSLDLSVCTVMEILRQVEPFLKTQASQRQVEVSLADENTLLNVDKGKMGQVLENLLSNAVKFSAGESSVRIRGELIDESYRISVADQGIGMTQEQVEKVFDKFYRADSSDTALEGVGLGMHIVKNIVETLGGRIWVESELGQRTTVNFTLPLAQKIGNDK